MVRTKYVGGNDLLKPIFFIIIAESDLTHIFGDFLNGGYLPTCEDTFTIWNFRYNR